MKKVQKPTVRKPLTVATRRIRWRLVLGLVAAITLMLTQALSSQRGAFGQLSSDLGPAQDAATSLRHVPPAAPTYTVLHTFTGGADGAYPEAGLLRDATGNLYGTTQFGATTTCLPPNGCGVVFELIRCDSGESVYDFKVL